MRSPVEGESGDWVQSPHWAELFSVPLPGYSTQWADEDEKKKKPGLAFRSGFHFYPHSLFGTSGI